ncbi:hypothetical protein BD626DRAFT_563756 [Schizophyllum amplum]|uniref:Uncharacterized protein n=1 Tax=Schizophyllum amplum TaxID=97359 RepID=A0A550CZ65_9AGAR|nr:hypothetical protein BD626DRAFT_563756 [Auriculariopsis ampla]
MSLTPLPPRGYCLSCPSLGCGEFIGQVGADGQLVATTDPKEKCRCCGHAYYLHVTVTMELSQITDPAYRKGGILGLCGGFMIQMVLAATVNFDTVCGGCDYALRAHGALSTWPPPLQIASPHLSLPSSGRARGPDPVRLAPSVASPINFPPPVSTPAHPPGIPAPVSTTFQVPTRASLPGSAPQQRRSQAHKTYHSSSMLPSTSSGASTSTLSRISGSKSASSKGKTALVPARTTFTIVVWPIRFDGAGSGGEYCLGDITINLNQFFDLHKRLDDHGLVFPTSVDPLESGNTLAQSLVIQIQSKLLDGGFTTPDPPDGAIFEDVDDPHFISSLPIHFLHVTKGRQNKGNKFSDRDFGPNNFTVKVLSSLAKQLTSPNKGDTMPILIIAPRYGNLSAPLSRLRFGIDSTVLPGASSDPHPCFGLRVLTGLTHSYDNDKFDGAACFSGHKLCCPGRLRPSAAPRIAGATRRRSTTADEPTGMSPPRNRARPNPPASTVAGSSRSLFQSAVPQDCIEVSSGSDSDLPPSNDIMRGVRPRPSAGRSLAPVPRPLPRRQLVSRIDQSARAAPIVSAPDSSSSAPTSSQPGAAVAPTTTSPSAAVTAFDTSSATATPAPPIVPSPSLDANDEHIRLWQLSIRNIVEPVSDDEALHIYASTVPNIIACILNYLDWIVRQRFQWHADIPLEEPEDGFLTGQQKSLLCFVQPADDRHIGLETVVAGAPPNKPKRRLTPGQGVEREVWSRIVLQVSQDPTHWMPGPVEGPTGGATLVLSGSASGASDARQHEARVHGALIALHCIYFGNPGPFSLWALLAIVMGKDSMDLPREFYEKHAPDQYAIMKPLLDLSVTDPLIPLEPSLASRARYDPTSVYTLITERLNENVATIGNVNRDPEDHRQLLIRAWSMLLLGHPDPWGHILLKQCREGFNLHLKASADGVRLLSMFASFNVPALLAAMCNRQIQDVGRDIIPRLKVRPVTHNATGRALSDEDKSFVALAAKLLHSRLVRYLSGTGHTARATRNGLVEQSEVDAHASDRIIRAKNLLIACHGSEYLPVEADWAIEVNVYHLAGDHDKSISFHSCFTSMDVFLTAILVKMMGRTDERWGDLSVSTEFDEWLHDQILSVHGFYNNQ